LLGRLHGETETFQPEVRWVFQTEGLSLATEKAKKKRVRKRKKANEGKEQKKTNL